jgi:hypothetical protein
MGRGEVYTGFWWRNLRERDDLEDQGVDGMIILRWIFRKLDMVARTGSIWLIETRGRAFVSAVMSLRFS